jgi:hypothetical protein
MLRKDQNDLLTLTGPGSVQGPGRINNVINGLDQFKAALDDGPFT